MKIQTKTISTICIAALAGAFMFASTGSSEAAKKKAKAAAAPTMGCVALWVPVCGKKGKKTMTYTNACMAKEAGAKVIAQGECVAKKK